MNAPALPVRIAYGKHFVLTIQERAGDSFDPVRARLRAGGTTRRMKADYLAYALLDTVVDGYFPLLERIGEDLEELEETVVSGPDPNALEHDRYDIVTIAAVADDVATLRVTLEIGCSLPSILKAGGNSAVRNRSEPPLLIIRRSRSCRNFEACSRSIVLVPGGGAESLSCRRT